MIGCGIYKIRNKINGKIYIGSSKNLQKRRNGHLCDLRRGRSECTGLQRAWNKYGEENFTFEVLIHCPEEYRLEIEQWYIDNLQPYKCTIGYNVSKKVVGNSYPRKNNTKNKRVDMYTLDGQYIRTFESIIDGAEYVDMDRATSIRGNIWSVCIGKCKQCIGYKWRYTDNRQYDDKIDALNSRSYKENMIKGRQLSEKVKDVGQRISATLKERYKAGKWPTNRVCRMTDEYKKELSKRMSEKRSISIIAIDKSGGKKVYKSARVAAKELQLLPQTITAACRGKYAIAKGYRFRYTDPKRAILYPVKIDKRAKS